MNTDALRIVDDFERGGLTRRQLVIQLMALGAAGSLLCRADDATTRPATQPSSTFAAGSIDHAALSVTNVKRSAEFYERHLGLHRVRDGGDQSTFLSTSGTDFVALFRGEKPGLHHLSFGLPDYDADDAARRIEAAGLKLRREDNRVYFTDPDGLILQVHPGRGLARP